MVGLGAAAGALAAAALVTTAPIASADDGIDDFALPALAVPTDTFAYTDETVIGEGSQTVTYDTVYDGSGTPVTTTTTDVLPTGDTEYGYFAEDTSSLTLGSDSFTSIFESELFDSTTAAGSTIDSLTPVFETFSNF